MSRPPTAMDFPRSPSPTQLLLVCMGNRCRSPMAQAVTAHWAQQAGLALRIDSAGTHAGDGRELPDPRARTVLAARGYVLGQAHARQVSPSDFGRYDLILAMDQANLDDLRRLCPADQTHKLHLFLAYAQGVAVREVPDPYYSTLEGFEHVLDLCEAGARGLLRHWLHTLG